MALHDMNDWAFCFKHSAITAGLVLCATFAGGCYSGKPAHQIGTISGTVTSGGKPVTEGDLNFFAAGTGFGMNATINPDGTYKVLGDIWTGKYVVFLTPPLPPMDGNAQLAAVKPGAGNFKKLVSAKYRDETASPLAAEVREGANVLNFELSP